VAIAFRIGFFSGCECKPFAIVSTGSTESSHFLGSAAEVKVTKVLTIANLGHPGSEAVPIRLKILRFQLRQMEFPFLVTLFAAG
jgi:hypothetical protein